MREILFRAKELNTGKWVEGNLVIIDENDYRIATKEDICSAYTNRGIYDGDMTCVVPETICQYTGLTDKNGKKIWENDVLRFEWDKKKIVDVIKYDPPMFTYSNSVRWNLCKDEVIGNIFDNPELLENE